MKSYSEFFKYCPKCSKSSLTLNNERMLSCSECEFIYFLPPSICNAVIIYNSKKEILLGRRSIEPEKGKWDLVGGFVEFNESLEQSVVREVLEETGLKIESPKYFMSVADKYEYKDLIYTTICAVFEFKYDGDKFNAADDVEELRFVHYSEIDIDNLAFDSGKIPLREFIKTLI